MEDEDLLRQGVSKMLRKEAECAKCVGRVLRASSLCMGPLMLAQFCKRVVTPLDNLIDLHLKAVGFSGIAANVRGF
jgi:hypothetical protein